MYDENSYVLVSQKKIRITNCSTVRFAIAVTFPTKLIDMRSPTFFAFAKFGPKTNSAVVAAVSQFSSRAPFFSDPKRRQTVKESAPKSAFRSARVAFVDARKTVKKTAKWAK